MRPHFAAPPLYALIHSPHTANTQPLRLGEKFRWSHTAGKNWGIFLRKWHVFGRIFNQGYILYKKKIKY